MLAETILARVSYAIWSLTSIFSSLEIPKENVIITYTLYTPDNPTSTIIANIDDIDINPEHDLKILCHGYDSHPNNYSTEWYQQVVDEYMKKGATNVITANYTYAIKNVKYYETAKYSEHIGAHVGKFILNLNKLKGIEFNKFHIIGHLLGAHVAGVAGETIYKETGKNIDRITGIDAVNMGYIEFQTDGRLSRNDADFVDAIHGGGGGFYEGLGRIDFYGYAFPQNCTYNWAKIQEVGPIYYANSINDADPMVGVKCLNKKYYYGDQECKNNVTTVLGENVDREMFGKFYLKAEDIAKYICKNVVAQETTTAVPSTLVVADDSE